MDLGNAAGSTYGQLFFNGTQTLGGTGTVLFGKNGSNSVYETAYRSSTLTIGSGITIRGSSGTIGSYYSSDTVVNQGTIAADDSGGLTTPFVYDTDFSGGFDRQHGCRHRRQRRDQPGARGGVPDLPRRFVHVHPHRPDTVGLVYPAAPLRRPGSTAAGSGSST